MLIGLAVKLIFWHSPDLVAHGESVVMPVLTPQYRANGFEHRVSDAVQQHAVSRSGPVICSEAIQEQLGDLGAYRR
jgi:hypothetical protein